MYHKKVLISSSIITDVWGKCSLQQERMRCCQLENRYTTKYTWKHFSLQPFGTTDESTLVDPTQVLNQL